MATKKSTRKKTSKKKTVRKKTAGKATARRKKAASKKKVSKKKVTRKKVTKKKTSKKKAASSAAGRSRTRKTTVRSAGASGSSKKKSKRAKSPLTRKELNEFLKLLLIKRAEILGDMDSMSRDALNIDAANLSHMPIHMADVGSDNYEQELTLGLVESERKLLQEIDDAIERLRNRTYGVCEATGKVITKARLNAKPWAKYCIEAAREIERFGRLR